MFFRLCQGKLYINAKFFTLIDRETCLASPSIRFKDWLNLGREDIFKTLNGLTAFLFKSFTTSLVFSKGLVLS